MNIVIISLVICLCSFCHVTAEPNEIDQTLISLQEYAQRVGNIDPATHRIPTLNHNGAAMCFSTELTEAFLAHCRALRQGRVLEVGCAYGLKASQIVQTGVFLVANDIDSRHLAIMQRTFEEFARKDSRFNNVAYLPGDISSEILGHEQYDAILCESVLHFMHPQEVRAALRNFYRSLRSGGKVYLTALSGYLENYREAFCKNKAKGVEWPGLFEDPSGLFKPYNVFDEEMLRRELTAAGFSLTMVKCISKPYLEQEYHNDGRDWVIAIAEKRL